MSQRPQVNRENVVLRASFGPNFKISESSRLDLVFVWPFPLKEEQTGETQNTSWQTRGNGRDDAHKHKLWRLLKVLRFGLEPQFLLCPLWLSQIRTSTTTNSKRTEYNFLYLQNGTFIYRSYCHVNTGCVGMSWSQYIYASRFSWNYSYFPSRIRPSMYFLFIFLEFKRYK